MIANRSIQRDTLGDMRRALYPHSLRETWNHRKNRSKLNKFALTKKRISVILKLFKNELNGGGDMDTSDYLDLMVLAQKHYNRHLEPISKRWSLTQNELDILLFLLNNPRFDRAADIVAKRGISKSHVSLAVNALGERQLLTRCSSPEDRRTVHLSLTPQGKIIAEEGKAAQQRYFTKLYQGITPEEFEHWNEIKGKMCRNIEELEQAKNP